MINQREASDHAMIMRSSGEEAPLPLIGSRGGARVLKCHLTLRNAQQRSFYNFLLFFIDLYIIPYRYI